MTIREIANILGFSPSTVHRAIKQPEKSKPEIIEQVHNILNKNIIENIGIKKIYIIVPHINEFYNKLIIDLMSIFNKHSIQLVPFITHEDKKMEYDFISSIPFSSRIGLIWTPTDTEKTYPFLKRLKNRPSIIFFNRNLTNIKLHTAIFLDNKGALEIAIEELIKSKNSKILLLNGELGLQTSNARKEGFLDAIKKHHNTEYKIIHTSFQDWQTAYKSIIKNKDIITNYDAIISSNELITYGILKGLKELNISIPKDIRFITIDDSFSIESQDLSTIYFPTKQISDTIAKIFFEHTHNLKDSVIYYITPRFILRGSEKVGVKKSEYI